MRKLLLILLLLFSFSNNLFCQKTHIYVVRHGEKDMSNPNNPNPNLSEAGLRRAQKLNDDLKRFRLSAAFTTNYNRTIQTLQPTAQRNKLNLLIYNPGNNAGLVNQVLTNYTNKRVIIAGHSDTVLEILDAFGAESPVKYIDDDDYSNFFHIVITPTSKRVSHKRY